MSEIRFRGAAWIPLPVRLALAVCLGLVLTSGIGGSLRPNWLQFGSAAPPESARTNLSATQGVARSTADLVNDLQAWLRSHPSDGQAYAQLGEAYLQRARETGDPNFYGRADAALARALELRPDDFEAMISQGSLALTRHAFPEALVWAERARVFNPYRSAIDGIVGDAQVELGQYDAAFNAFQAMIDRRPDLASYSRVSYARELLGDTEGAIAAMRQAVKLGPPTGENTAWCRVQLGTLLATYTDDLAGAEAEYRRALVGYPDYVHAQAGLARIATMRGDYQSAIASYQSLVTVLPLPEFIIALGDLYTVAGRSEDADRQYALVRAVQELNRANGVDVDLELALFDADHERDLPVALARAQEYLAQRPSIKAADVLAWTLYKSGDYQAARSASEDALRLGTRDPLLAFHAGMIARQLGDVAGAREHLNRALVVTPSFSILHANQARRVLDELAVPR